MAESETTVTPGSGLPVGVQPAFYRGTWQGLLNRLVAPFGLVLVSGPADNRTFTDAPGDGTNGLDVDVTRVPTDPFGANADLASTTGSISAKLRSIATNIATALTSLTTLAGGVVSSRYQVDIVSGGLTITRPGTATVTNPAMTTASASVIGSNVNRLGLIVNNPNDATLYLKMGTSGAALASKTVAIDPFGTWTDPTGYTGAYVGALSTGSGTLDVTELTA